MLIPDRCVRCTRGWLLGIPSNTGAFAGHTDMVRSATHGGRYGQLACWIRYTPVPIRVTPNIPLTALAAARGCARAANACRLDGRHLLPYAQPAHHFKRRFGICAFCSLLDTARGTPAHTRTFVAPLCARAGATPVSVPFSWHGSWRSPWDSAVVHGAIHARCFRTTGSGYAHPHPRDAPTPPRLAFPTRRTHPAPPH